MCICYLYWDLQIINCIQTRTIDLPSDSSFALAMKSQQQADREEQQRIKSLVLNYEMTNEPENTGEGKHLPIQLPYSFLTNL